ncbi:MAG TPA: TolC family protein, partial [Polyangiaceae bacterium]|nr:TolC family protein [Polyangiaceae bacterium]
MALLAPAAALAAGPVAAEPALAEPARSAALAPPGVERISLEAAMRRALARNPSVATAVADLRRAEALVEQARAASLPTLTANGTYTRLDADRVLNGNVIAAANQLSANLNLTVPIIVPQRWNAWTLAGDNVDVAHANSDDVRRRVGLAAARAYLTVIAQRRVVEANERARDVSRAHYEFARARREGGIGNRLDEVRAAQELAGNDSRLASSLASLGQAREALGVLLGADGPVEPADEGSSFAPPPLAEAMSTLAARRPDLHALELRLRLTERAARLSWAEFSPSLVGQFVPFYQNPPTLTQPQTGWQALLLLSVPLYDGGLRYGVIHEREALRASARAGYEGAVRQARADVRAANESLRRTGEALGSAREAARLAEEARALADEAYRAGATTNLEVVDAERRARDADTAAAAAEDAERQARLDLLAATGSLPGIA